LELRETTGSASDARPDSVISKRTGFLLSNGDVVDIDGSLGVGFNVDPQDDLYLVVKHRNHLGIMSSTPLQGINNIYNYDFSDSSEKVFGSPNAYKYHNSGIWMMISGDGNGNGQVDNNDKNEIWLQELNFTNYLSGDFDLNGMVNEIDKSIYWAPNAGQGSQVPK